MAALFGALQPYDPATDWALYELALKQFLAANNIKSPGTGATDPDRRVPILLSSIGLRSLSVIRSLCAPAAPDSKTFDQLLELLKKHFGKTPSKSLARQKFNEARQRDSETVEQFDARLRELAIDCDYGGSLEDRLKEQLINGVREDALKKKLLGSEEDSLADLLKKARTFEQVARDVRSSRQSDSASSDAHYVQQARAPTSKSTRPQPYSSRPPGTQLKSADCSRNPNASGKQPIHPCHRCGGTTHFADACWYRDKECNYCHGIGHKAKVCNRAARDRAAQSSSKPHSSSASSSSNSNSSSKPSNSKNRGSQHQFESEPFDFFDGSINAISSSVDTVG
jgi:hypothetical protein